MEEGFSSERRKSYAHLQLAGNAFDRKRERQQLTEITSSNERTKSDEH
jgi:hypothetical protein